MVKHRLHVCDQEQQLRGDQGLLGAGGRLRGGSVPGAVLPLLGRLRLARVLHGAAQVRCGHRGLSLGGGGGRLWCNNYYNYKNYYNYSNNDRYLNIHYNHARNNNNNYNTTTSNYNNASYNNFCSHRNIIIYRIHTNNNDPSYNTYSNNT